MRMTILAALPALLATLPSSAHALPDDLFSAQTIVTGTEEPERTRGFREGLRDVVVKLTGRADLASGDLVDALSMEPHAFVERFTYEDRMKGIPVHDEQGTRERPHILRMSFDEDAVREALAQAGLSIWDDRPTIAVWLAVETADGGYVLRAEGADGYGQRAVLEDTAARRGLPIRLPDASSPVTYADLVAGSIPPSADAADRTAQLVGRLDIGAKGYWDMAWHLMAACIDTGWTLDDVTFDTALKSGLETAAARLSKSDPSQCQRP